LGEKILEKALLSLNKPLNKIPENNIQDTLDALSLKSRDELFTSIANGNQSAKLVAQRLIDDNELAALDKNQQDRKFTNLLLSYSKRFNCRLYK